MAPGSPCEIEGFGRQFGSYCGPVRQHMARRALLFSDYSFTLTSIVVLDALRSVYEGKAIASTLSVAGLVGLSPRPTCLICVAAAYTNRGLARPGGPRWHTGGALVLEHIVGQEQRPGRLDDRVGGACRGHVCFADARPRRCGDPACRPRVRIGAGLRSSAREPFAP